MHYKEEALPCNGETLCFDHCFGFPTFQIKEWLPGTSGKTKNFGLGGPSERSCESFRYASDLSAHARGSDLFVVCLLQTRAFLECRGHVSTEKKTVELPSGSTLEDARAKFGRHMRQQHIMDADGYQLEPSSEIWKYSKDCNISLVFRCVASC